MSSTPDAGPVVALSFEPVGAAPIWEGPAAAARDKLEPGTYFAPDQVVGITGEGVLVTEENTGRSTYFLATVDIVEQHLADLTYQVLTVVPDTYGWAAPGLHDMFDLEHEVVDVRTIDGSYYTFDMGQEGTETIRALQKLQGEQAVNLPNPVHVDTALREHVAFLVEVGLVRSGAETRRPDGYNRVAAAGRVLEGIGHGHQAQADAARDAVQRLADDARQGRYWTEQFVHHFADELEAVKYPASIARAVTDTYAEHLNWQSKAQVVIHAGTAPSTLHLLVDLADQARQLRGGEEPIPGTIDRWKLAAAVAAENLHIGTRGQAEMLADLINMRDPDITQAVLLNGGTFASRTTTTAHPRRTGQLTTFETRRQRHSAAGDAWRRVNSPHELR